MCLIAIKPFGETMPEEHLVRAAEHNPHGFGLTYRLKDSEDVSLLKTMDIVEYMDAVKRVSSPDYETVYHLRMATHGSKCVENCHPFKTIQGAYLYHNGIFHIKSVDNKTDSELFKEQYFDATWEDHATKKTYQLTLHDLHNPKFVPLINKYSQGQRLVLHSRLGVMNYAEDAGEVIKGCWYSNQYSIEPHWQQRVYDCAGNLWFPDPDDKAIVNVDEIYSKIDELVPESKDFPYERERVMKALGRYLDLCEGYLLDEVMTR